MELLQELVAGLAIPGLPAWSGLVAALVLGLVALAYLLMPFSVFGLKGRLDMIEAQLDEIQAEMRSLLIRLPEPPRRAPSEEYVEAPMLSRRTEGREFSPTPPVPPPPAYPSGGRAEPRLDWPHPPR